MSLCKYCGESLANNDAAEEHAGTCPVMNGDVEFCDICGFADTSETSSVVHKCKDGVLRCKLCRQKAVYGRTFANDDDEFEAYKRGEGDKRRDIA